MWHPAGIKSGMTAPDDVTTHDAAELETWHVTIPRPGGPQANGQGLQGVITERFLLTREASDDLEASLRRLNIAAARRGRPRYWRGEREVVGKLADNEERAEVTALAEEISPPPGARDPATGSLENYRNLLEQECKALQARKATLLAELQAAEARNEKILQNQVDHLTAQTAKLRTAEAQIYDGFADELQRVVNARKLLGELQPRDGLAEAIREGRQLIEAAASSSVGQLGALWVSGLSAQKLAKRMGKDVKPEQVLDAAIFNGAAFKLRCQAVRNLAASQTHPTAKAMLTAIDFVVGDVPPEALTRYFKEAQ